MKKILITLLITLPLSLSAQYAIVDFFVLNEGMEEEYIALEELWQIYHQNTIDNGDKIFWSVWKRESKEDDGEFAAHYVTINQFASMEDLENENKNFDFEKVVSSIKSSMKGKMSSRKIDKILNVETKKQMRRYVLRLNDATPLQGSIELGDVMKGSAMIKKDNDYEQYESNVAKLYFQDNIKKGNLRWWAFTEIIERSEDAYDDLTHFTWSIRVQGTKMEKDYSLFGNKFTWDKLSKLVSNSRDVKGSNKLTLIMKAN